MKIMESSDILRRPWKVKNISHFSLTQKKNDDDHFIKIASMVNSYKASMLKPNEFWSKYLNPAQSWYLIRYGIIGKSLSEILPHFDLL